MSTSEIIEQGFIQLIKSMLNDEVKFIVAADAKKEKDSSDNIVPLDIDKIFKQFYQRSCPKPMLLGKRKMHISHSYCPRRCCASRKDSFGVIYIQILTGDTITLDEVNFANATVAETKLRIEEKEGLPPDQQRLFFDECQLSDEHLLRHYHVKNGSTLHLVVWQCGGGFSLYYVNPNYFDSVWDYDYRRIKVDKKVFRRNKFVYQRPLGCMRRAIKVLGKYENDGWLKNDDGTEWPVAYHGTLELNAEGIVKNGFDLAKTVRNVFGPGIYCTPNPRAALDYSKPYTFRGKRYRLILQTRVDPSKLKVHKTGYGQPHNEYWTLPDSAAIRPYGICFYER